MVANNSLVELAKSAEECRHPEVPALARGRGEGFVSQGGANGSTPACAGKSVESDAYEEYMSTNYMLKDPLFGDDFADYLTQYTADLQAGLGTE